MIYEWHENFLLSMKHFGKIYISTLCLILRYFWLYIRQTPAMVAEGSRQTCFDLYQGGNSQEYARILQ